MRHSAVAALRAERVARLDRHPRSGPESAGAAECRTQAGDRHSPLRPARLAAAKTARPRAPTISPARPARRRPPARMARATRRRIRCPAARGTEEPGSHAPSQDTRGARQRQLERARRAGRQPDRPGEILQAQRRHRPCADHGDGRAGLSDEQKKAIAASVKAANSPVQTTNAKPAEELPWTITVHDLGISANDPALARMKIVRAQDRILLIDPPNRIVIGEIKN